MSKKLYVGNLPYNLTDDELRDTFSKAGAVEEATVLKDPTGRSRGFGFVTMTNDDEAMKAIETLNEQDMGGRKLVVNEARPKTDKPRRSFGGGGGFGGGGYNRGGGRDY